MKHADDCPARWIPWRGKCTCGAESQTGCDRCNGCGSEKTYANQACLPISGKVRGIDWCIHQIVAALNAGGVETVASCCGHGTQDGRIDLADGRVLILPKRVVAWQQYRCQDSGDWQAG